VDDADAATLSSAVEARGYRSRAERLS
jgi:hypothetical protein